MLITSALVRCPVLSSLHCLTEAYQISHAHRFAIFGVLSLIATVTGTLTVTSRVMVTV